MRLIRVFPRQTNASPVDSDVRFDIPSMLDFDDADEVRVSVTFVEDIKFAEYLAESWMTVTSNVKIGGPAYNDPGGEFVPGLYLKSGYVITSRGCPNSCWFCKVPEREGSIRELDIKDGYNVLDSNLLACSKDHISKVFKMLSHQKIRPKFTGGLESRRVDRWVAQELYKLKPSVIYFAYDTEDDLEPLISATKLFKEEGVLTDTNKICSCYVLIGFKGDTFEKAIIRLNRVLELGLMPFAMLYNRGISMSEIEKKKWRQLQREYANKIIVGSKLSKVRNGE